MNDADRLLTYRYGNDMMIGNEGNMLKKTKEKGKEKQ